MPELVLTGGGKESRIDLTGRDVTLGREATNDVALNDPRVSRQHAKIIFRDGRYFLEDLRSTHGSLVDGRRVTRLELKDGDRVQLGDTVLIFRDPDHPKPAAPPEAEGEWPQVYTRLSAPHARDEGFRWLQALYGISQLLQSTEDYPSALRHIMDKAVEMVGAERGILLLPDPEDGQLKVAVARVNQSDAPGVEAEKVSRSVMEKVMESGEPLLISNAQSQEWGTASVMAHSIHSVLCVPLMTRGRPAGLLYVDHRSRNVAFTERDLAFFTTFALQVKAAVDASAEIRALVARLTEANAKLRELNEMKSEFVGMVSHELKTPLTTMRGYVDLLLRDKADPPSAAHKTYLEKVQSNILRTAELISDLLNLTRIETGKIPLRPEPLDLKKLLAEVVEALEMQAQAKGVQVVLNVPADFPNVEGDADLLRRLLQNFVSNGIKYNKEKSRLEVSAQVQDSRYVLTFADQGIGISPQDIQKLFSRFFRSDAVRDISGTGLGLSIVKAIVDRHGGKIRVESELGRGTTFRVTLPLKLNQR